MTDHAAKIEELKNRHDYIGPVASEAITLAESLLAELTAIREAGDEEVEECAREAENGIGTDWYGDRKGCQNASEYLERLHDIAISRVQQLAEARKRVEELEARIAVYECEEGIG